MVHRRSLQLMARSHKHPHMSSFGNLDLKFMRATDDNRSQRARLLLKCTCYNSNNILLHPSVIALLSCAPRCLEFNLFFSISTTCGPFCTTSSPSVKINSMWHGFDIYGLICLNSNKSAHQIPSDCSTVEGEVCTYTSVRSVCPSTLLGRLVHLDALDN